MGVCHDGSFTTVAGELTLARAGAFRPVKTAYQTAADGPYTEHPSPGRTQIEIDTTWVNTTGVPQIVMAQLDRAPWLIISTNMQQSAFMERYSFAVGINPRAATPAASIDYFRSAADNPPSYTYFWVTSRARPIVSYGAQDRNNEWLMQPQRVEPGQGVNVRYICSLFTDGQPVIAGGTPRKEAYARWANLVLWAGPAAP